MSAAAQQPTRLSEEPTLGEVVAQLWDARLYLIIWGIVGAVLAMIWLFMAVPHYRANMLVGPAERAGGPDINALLPDNSSFAVQYLVNTLGTPDSTDFVRFEHTLRGPSVAGLLMKSDYIRKRISEDKRFKFQGAPAINTAVDFSAYLEDHVSIEPVGTTALRRLVYSHPDQEFAMYFLEALHAAADYIIQKEIRTKTEQRAEYLAEMIEEVHHPDHKAALTSILMEQEHIRMILEMDDFFAAVIAEPPAAPDRIYWPKKTLIFAVFIFAGILLGFVHFNLNRTEPL